MGRTSEDRSMLREVWTGESLYGKVGRQVAVDCTMRDNNLKLGRTVSSPPSVDPLRRPALGIPSYVSLFRSTTTRSAACRQKTLAWDPVPAPRTGPRRRSGSSKTTRPRPRPKVCLLRSCRLGIGSDASLFSPCLSQLPPCQGSCRRQAPQRAALLSLSFACVAQLRCVVETEGDPCKRCASRGEECRFKIPLHDEKWQEDTTIRMDALTSSVRRHLARRRGPPADFGCYYR